MKTLAYISVFIILAVYVLDAPAQQGEGECLILSAKVSRIPETNNEDDAHLYTFIDYEVIKVLDGVYTSSTIRVAQTTLTAKNLKVGGIVCLKLAKTDRFRRMAKDLLETGKVLPQEFIADYIYAGYKQSCSCSTKK
jgi:hypothetical protein